jgi:hypothetical protein
LCTLGRQALDSTAIASPRETTALSGRVALKNSSMQSGKPPHFLYCAIEAENRT